MFTKRQRFALVAIALQVFALLGMPTTARADACGENGWCCAAQTPSSCPQGTSFCCEWVDGHKTECKCRNAE